MNDLSSAYMSVVGSFGLTPMTYKAMGFEDANAYTAFNGISFSTIANNNMPWVLQPIKKGGFNILSSGIVNIFNVPDTVTYIDSGKYDLKKIILKKKIGSGSYGTVFLSELKNIKTGLRERVAVKIELLTDPYKYVSALAETDKQLYIREQSIINKEINDYFIEVSDKFFIKLNLLSVIDRKTKLHAYSVTILELMDGNLKGDFKYVKESPADIVPFTHDFAIAKLYHYTTCLLKIVELLTELGIIHRDIKFENFLFKKTQDKHKDIIKISDFGLALYENEVYGAFKFKKLVFDNDTLKKTLDWFPQTNIIYEKEWATIGIGNLITSSPEIVFYTGWKNSNFYIPDVSTGNYLFSQLPESYRKELTTKSYNLSENIFEIGVTLFSLWFGETAFLVTNWPKKSMKLKGILLRYEYLTKLLYFGEDAKNIGAKELVNDADLNNTKPGSKFLKDVYKNLDTLLIKMRNPYVDTFLSTIKIPSELRDSISNNFVLYSIAHLISLFLLPNPGYDLKLKSPNGDVFPAKRITSSDFPIILKTFEYLTTFDDKNHDHNIMLWYRQLLHLDGMYGKNFRFFDGKEFGSHNTRYFIHDIDNQIELKLFDSNLNRPHQACGHRLEKKEFASHLLENQEKIKNDLIPLCYKCKRSINLF